MQEDREGSDCDWKIIWRNSSVLFPINLSSVLISVNIFGLILRLFRRVRPMSVLIFISSENSVGLNIFGLSYWTLYFSWVFIWFLNLFLSNMGNTILEMTQNLSSFEEKLILMLFLVWTLLAQSLIIFISSDFYISNWQKVFFLLNGGILNKLAGVKVESKKFE